MNDIADSTRIADLERRVDALEIKVASLPDVEQLTDRIKASLPQPVDPTQPPGLKDLSLPIPSAASILSTAKTTWAIIEMLAELKSMLWMLLDRRYHMGWLTRLVAILLLAAILLSHWWVPFGQVEYLGAILNKAADLLLALALFLVLSAETRRYNEWRRSRP